MKIAVQIEGRTPLLCNRFTEEAQMSATSGNRTSLVGKKKTPREIAEEKLYLSESKPHKPVIPGANLFRCIIDAGKFFKAGKTKVTTQKTSLIPACVAIAEIEIPIKHNDPWDVDERPVRIPSTGGRILAYRPRFNDWSLSFHLWLDWEMMSPKMLRDILDAAGKRIGLGDFRPDCKGAFGKFDVTMWKILGGKSGKK